MRKYFWGFGLCGVLLTGGSVFVAHHAARHPHSFVGRVMHGATFAASKMSPVGGFAPVLASLNKKAVAENEECCAAADPVPVEESLTTPVIAHSSAPIVIPEDDLPSIEPGPMPKVEPFAPTSAVVQAPSNMLSCEEEECETLPMPLVEDLDDEEEQEAGSVGGAVGGFFRLFFQMPKLPTEEPAAPTEAEQPMPKAEEVQADPYHHHHHYSGCPYTGRMHRDCPSGCPGPKSNCEEPKQSGSEEASEEGTEKPNEKSALGKIRKFKKRQSLDDGCPTHPGVDTMEMRPSDRQLYEYGPSGK